MATIDERNEKNRELTLEEKLDKLTDDVTLLRYQHIGILAGLMLLGAMGLQLAKMLEK